MGAIYSHADAVILYLGPAASHDAEGIDLITTLYKHFEPDIQPIIDMNWWFAYRRSAPLPVENLPDHVTMDHPGWPGLLDIAMGSWIERTWIVQENVLNPDTFILRGHRTISWESVATMLMLFVVELLPLSLLSRSRRKRNASLDCYIDSVCHSMEVRSKKSDATRLTLGENLQWYDALDCSDLRDHIYSILALSNDVDELEIIPNYSVSVQAVFIDVTVRMLTTYREIRHFHYVSLLDNLSDPSYPSWSLTPRLLGRQHYLDSYLYAAHPIRSAVYEFNSAFTELTAKGCIFDHISFSSSGDFVQSSTFWNVPKLEEVRRLVNELASFAFVLDNVGTTGKTISELLICLIVEKFRDDARHSVRRDPVHALWCYLLLAWEEIARNREKLPEDKRKVLPSIESMIKAVAEVAGKQSESLTKAERELGKHIESQKITYGRSFAVTQQNRIINCTFKATVGDSIALLQGGRLPFLLRATGEKFQFVGDACVPGMMYGEAYAGLVPQKVDYEIHLI